MLIKNKVLIGSLVIVCLLVVLSIVGDGKAQQKLGSNNTTAQPTQQKIVQPSPQPQISLDDLKREAEARAAQELKDRANVQLSGGQSKVNNAVNNAKEQQQKSSQQHQNNNDNNQKQLSPVVLVMCSDDLSKTLVLDVNNGWVENAKEIKVEINAGTSSRPKVECMVYKGLFRPNSPEIRSWSLQNIILVDSKEFQEVINNLHNQSQSGEK